MRLISLVFPVRTGPKSLFGAGFLGTDLGRSRDRAQGVELGIGQDRDQGATG